jgi:thiamine biosynthesis protein ThiS
MRLKLNGEEREVEPVSTVEELIRSLGIHRMIVVEHNGEIVRKERYAERAVNEGDTVEIVHMVGGG